MSLATGRPTKYRPEMARQVDALGRLGAVDRDVADVFGVSLRTIHAWKRSRPDFLHSLRRGKLIADAAVADALYRRAVGSADYPPHTAACIFWLKNRRPREWGDRPPGRA